MFDISSRKLGLDQAVLSKINNGEEGVTLTKALDKKVIDSLLKNGAYDLLNKEDDKFGEEDIDQILTTRAKTIVHGETVGLSNFSKASFTSSSAGRLHFQVKI